MNQEDWSYIREEGIQEALIRFRKSLATGRKTYFDVSEFEGIVECLLDEGDINTSEIAVLQGIQIHPGAVPLQLKYAQVLLSKGKHQAAIKYLNLAEQVEPTNPDVHLMKGLAWLILGKETAAQHAFENALKSPESEKDEILYHIGSAYVQVGDIENALGYFEKSLEVNPENEMALYDLGFFSDQEGQYDKSIEYYNRYLDIDPFNFSIWFNLGISYNKAGNYDKAIEAYEYAHVLNEAFDQSLFNIGNAYANAGKFSEAIEKYKEYLELDPDNDDALCYIGECYLSLDNPAMAESFYRKSLEINPENDTAVFGTGLVNWSLKLYPLAVNNVLEAIELDSAVPEYWITLAKIYKDMNRVADAEKALIEVAAFDRDNGDVWLTWVDVYMLNNDIDLALAILNDGLETSRDSRLLYRKIALLLEKKQYQEAYRILHASMEIDFSNINYLFDVYPKALKNRKVRMMIAEFRSKNNY